ncbi:MAG: peptidoglycan DD-metalloendopeptidase family protein [Clostridia bacterium]|nr:peptidoglycan DD-metalloendopeptidase family protein [Clostridia bacterium]
MKQNNIATKVIAFFLCFTLVFVSFAAFTPDVYAAKKNLSSLKSEQAQIKDKVEESEKKIKELEKQQAQQEEIISELNNQIAKLNDQLDNVRSQQTIINGDIKDIEKKIADLDEEIKDLDEQILEKDKEIEDTIDIFCERIRANYMAGETSVLEMFTASSSLGNFLNRLELFRRVTQNDQALVNKLNEEIAEIEEMQKKLQEKKQSVEAEKAALEVKKYDLQSAENELNSTQATIIAKSTEVNKKLAALNYQTKQLEISLDKYNKEMDKIEDEIEAFLKQQQASSGGSSNAGSAPSNISKKGWAWPVPYSNSYITSPYGYRNDPISGVYKFHSGIDISMAGAHGKKLVATKAGTVIRAVHSSSGYGNYVLIDHGGGFSSLYAHCSKLAVKVGDKVAQNQVIAYIGSTGYSTGPHVHFEIRYNGEKQNPSHYVSK